VARFERSDQAKCPAVVKLVYILVFIFILYYYNILVNSKFYWFYFRSTEEEGLSNSRDFKITAGAVTSEPVSGLRFLPGGTGLLTISRG
jgi:hypothetical protein